MFTFHKSDPLTRSRQSSVDSPIFEISTPPTTSDAWGSQYFEASHNQDMPSPEQRRRAQPAKRNSVFTLRSRSNTATSIASSVPPSPRSTADGASEASFPFQGASQSYFEHHGQKRSMFRGKMGKRLSDSLGPSPASDENQDDAGKKRSSFLRNRRKGSEADDALYQFKQRISRPFDFQHLTHANRHHAAALEHGADPASAGRWTERATKYPNSSHEELVQNLSADNLEPEGESLLSGYTSPLRSPQIFSEVQDAFAQMPASKPGLRLTRSVESFSQPGGAPRVHRHSQSTVAPIRASSLVPPIDAIPEEDAEKRGSVSSVAYKRQSGVWDAFAPTTEGLDKIEEDLPNVGHALTTPDDSAIHSPIPLFSPSLEDVAEEPDRFVSPRPAPQPPRNRAATSPMSPCFEAFSFSSPRSVAAPTRTRGNSQSSPRSALPKDPVPRPSSQMSDTLGSPSRKRLVAKPSRNSNTWSTMEESWEDDVDYIYENALEADCDFDWDCVSEEPTVDENPAFRLQAPRESFRPSLLIPSARSVPDLVAPSARSTSTAELTLQTPFSEREGFLLSPSLLVPHVYKDDPETTYEDILKEYDGSDCHFPFMDVNESANSSARSSRVRFSRRSSYDSSLMSSAQGSGLLNSPLRRSASSSGSLPELIYSRKTRREFSLVVDELSEQIASLECLGCDTEYDMTPPGPSRASESYYESRDSGVFTSQLLSKHHHTSSDGAAQLLAAASEDKPSKTRKRAATSQPQLSLFPSPQKQITPSVSTHTLRL